MKVKITTTLDVDPERWSNEFGIEREDVRKDVQTYFEGLCREQLSVLGLEKD